MMRIEGLNLSYPEVFDTCLSGVNGNSRLRECLHLNREALSRSAEAYIKFGQHGMLNHIEPLRRDMGINPIILDGLSKKDLISLYSLYFVKRNKPEARKIYDKLMSMAKDKCPFCGGVGKPENLDHYLAKKYYPQFSILPQNLIPSCRDCNMGGKGQSLAETSGEQVIHPFLDHEKFFNEQWIFAEYRPSVVENELGLVHYYVDPPAQWNDVDKNRVYQHFSAFNLDEVYSLQAAESLIIIFSQIQGVQEFCTSNEEIVNALLQKPLDTVKTQNHWRIGFFQALINHFSHVS